MAATNTSAPKLLPAKNVVNAMEAHVAVLTQHRENLERGGKPSVAANDALIKWLSIYAVSMREAIEAVERGDR